jgi:hypothetical protein
LGFAQDNANVARCERASVEIAEIAELAGRARWYHAMAKIVFAARVKLDVCGQYATAFIQQSDQSAIMIKMAVANNQGIERLRLDADNFHIVEQRFRRVSIIEHKRSRLSAFQRIQKVGKAPLGV